MDDQKQYQVMTVRLEMALYKQFRQIAFNEDKKMNAYVREFVQKLVEKKET